ncbi:MAG: terminase [Acidobacteriota bacterium]
MRTLRDSWLLNLAAELVPADEPAPPEEETPAAPLWEPLPGPQAQAFASEADLLLFGGAAGGGKTGLSVGLAVTRHRRSIIFRRQFKQLREIEDQLRRLVGGQGRYNANDKIWRLGDGRLIELGAVQRLEDWQKYAGRPHDLVCFDEGAQFLEQQFRSLIAWNRTEILGQRCRVVVGSNPPATDEGEWLITFWAPWLDDQCPGPALPGELRWFVMTTDDFGKPRDHEVESGAPVEIRGEMVRPLSRTFVPSRVEDNPFYMATGYKATLQALPEPLRSQLLKGDFKAGREDNPWQVIPSSWVKAAIDRWRHSGGASQEPMTCMGVDVARGGQAKTVLAPRHGAWYAPLHKHPGQTTPNGPLVAALVRAALRDQAHVNVDVIGVGASVYDHLVGARVPVVGVNVAQKSLRSDGKPHTDRTGKLLMRNLRAFAYWGFREALDPETGVDLALPPDQELLADLTAPRWQLTAAGVEVEDKQDIVERLGRSPDCGDAVVLAWLPTVAPGFTVAVSGSRTWARAGADL